LTECQYTDTLAFGGAFPNRAKDNSST